MFEVTPGTVLHTGLENGSAKVISMPQPLPFVITGTHVNILIDALKREKKKKLKKTHTSLMKKAL